MPVRPRFAEYLHRVHQAAAVDVVVVEAVADFRASRCRPAAEAARAADETSAAAATVLVPQRLGRVQEFVLVTRKQPYAW